MKNENILALKWSMFLRKIQPTVDKWKQHMKPLAEKVTLAWDYVLKYKKMFLTLPVAAMALILAIQNLIKLPALVGFGIQANGEYSIQIIREVAVLGPLVITVICLLLVLVSKRTLTPWMVSVLSLLLPLLILLTNVFST